MSNCTQCHVLGKSVSQVKCLTCHKEIKNLINFKRGYHSSKEVNEKKCWDCHGEHFGRNFEIVRFDKEKFDHNLSGFELKGSHKDLDCKKCHNSKMTIDVKLKKRESTYLGLSNQCADCHEDVHQNTLGNKCSTCHNENKFIPAVNFNHDNAKFRLKGKHVNVECILCHPKTERNEKTFQKFNGLNFNTCNSCHNDIHKGKFGNKCESCHSTNSFKSVKTKKGFNHAITGFKLIGKHKYVKCESCHENNLTTPIKHEKCIDCHFDFHEGEFFTQPSPKDCKDCHSESGFSPSLFTLEMHNKTNFKLLFAHAATPCNKCHLKQDKWLFKINGNTCVSCHTNFHGNKISSLFFNENNCESCHSVTNWSAIGFDHNKTEFKLNGEHTKTVCSNCHFVYRNEKIIDQKFSSLNSNCSQCHNDVHDGQFTENNKELCENCHTTNNWQPVLFNHNNTRFKIDGAHQNVQCIDCHKTNTAEERSFVQYKIEDIRCINCHS